MPHSAGNEQAGAGIVCVYYMSAIVYNIVNYAEHPLTVGTACGQSPGPALPLSELGGCLKRWAKGALKIQLCGSESDERTSIKGNEQDESK